MADNIIQIEHYQEEDAQNPTGYLRFLNRWARFKQDSEAANWSSVVLDSVTSMDISARKLHQYVLNPASKDPRQWYGGSKESLEEMLYINFGALRTNVAVIAHVDEDKDEVSGEFVRNPAAPGKLTKRLPAGYAELYHSFCRRNGTNREYVIRTASDGKFGAQTQLVLPELIVMPKGAGWNVVYEADPAAADTYQHVLWYGDYGTGKSTAVSFGPLPMLVFMFDPVGKDTPYRRRGKLVDSHDEEAAWDEGGQCVATTHVEVVEVSDA